MLLEANLIDEVQLRIALQEQKQRQTRFGSTLLALHFVDENVLTAFLSKQLDIPCVSLANVEIQPRLLEKVPKHLAIQYHVLPIREEKGKLHVAMCDPMDFETIEALERHTGWSVAPMVAPQSSIIESIDRYYSHTGRRRPGAEDGAPGAFPDLVREVEEAEVFGRQFSEVHDKLDRIDERLGRIEALLAQRRGEE
jgi:type IV pilus assembly protein PilB